MALNRNPAQYGLSLKDREKIESIFDAVAKGFSSDGNTPPMWHAVRNLRETKYGTFLFDELISFMMDVDNMYQLFEIAEVDRRVANPDYISLRDLSGFLKNVALVPRDGVRFSDHHDSFRAFVKDVAVAKLLIENAEDKTNFYRRVPVVANTVPETFITADELSLNNFRPEIPSKIQALSTQLRHDGLVVVYRGVTDLRDDVSHLEKFEDKVAYLKSSNLASDMLDVFPEIKADGGTHNNVRLVFDIVRREGPLYVDDIASSNRFEVVEPDEAVKTFMEDGYQPMFVRDIVMHSLITGDEIILPVPSEILGKHDHEDADNTDKNTKSKTFQGVSSFACTWLLSEEEITIARLIGCMFRGLSSGFTLDLTNKSPIGMWNELMNILWEEGMDSYQLMLRVIDVNMQWGTIPPQRTMTLVKTTSPDEVEANLLLPNEKELKGMGMDVEALKREFCTMIWDTKHKDFDAQSRQFNELVMAFDQATFSVILNAEDASCDSIDPLIPLPEKVYHSDMSKIIGSVQNDFSNLLEHPKINYIGRRNKDNRFVFTYVDDNGNVALPRQNITVTF